MTDTVQALLLRTYYEFKPFLPSHLRLAFRRIRARSRRIRFSETWPIDRWAGRAPPNWRGWPDGKQFALVLTHDVEGKDGMAQCFPLLELEKSLGFRSSFNFIPEGDYGVSAELLNAIRQQGFEVGVHDLNHDGKLFRTRAGFQQRAHLINQYLRDWQAVGFRSGFMLRENEWLHDLHIQYDASSFDTDPFEPQPDGVQTIFPFWVPGREGGYVELPYTLVQDFTLFVVLQEADGRIWKNKLRWIAQQGGMALLDTHPDYMTFAGRPGNSHRYPAEYYRDFLEHVMCEYQGQFWHPLPRDMAAFINPTTARRQAVTS
jgi:hypothetical protein